MRKNFLKQEFIGLPVRVVECSDTTMKGMEGEIIDETKNMLVVETEQGIKKIAKKIATFEINGVVVEGKKIAYRPEDRIRKIR